MIDKNYITRTTANKLEYAEFTRERLKNFDIDPKKEDRLKAQECKYCYYMRSGVATQAFVQWTCGICNTEQQWSNGDYPRICKECAIKHNLCMHCGADIDLRVKRRKFDL